MHITFCAGEAILPMPFRWQQQRIASEAPENVDFARNSNTFIKMRKCYEFEAAFQVCDPFNLIKLLRMAQRKRINRDNLIIVIWIHLAGHKSGCELVWDEDISSAATHNAIDAEFNSWLIWWKCTFGFIAGISIDLMCVQKCELLFNIAGDMFFVLVQNHYSGSEILKVNCIKTIENPWENHKPDVDLWCERA